MKNQTSIDKIDDIIGFEAAKSVAQDLKLRHVRVFNAWKGAHIVWAAFCFIAANVLFRQDATILYGAGFALLFVHSLLGSPIHYALDSASQKRLDAWIETQRPNA
jgi:hypothetical protein